MALKEKDKKTKSEKTSKNETVQSEKQNDTPQYYVVKKGESMGGIATKLNTTVANLKKCNKIKKNTILPGQKLKICR